MFHLIDNIWKPPRSMEAEAEADAEADAEAVFTFSWKQKQKLICTATTSLYDRFYKATATAATK